MNELEKCLAGEWYDCHNEIFLEYKKNARELLAQYHSFAYDQKKEKTEVLKKLFGGIGTNVSVGTPFLCDYGKNIYLGTNVSVNMNCTFVDCNKIEIGNNVHVVGGYGINRIGGNAACCLAAGDGAELRIGDGAGISNSCLWAMERIEIGAHANIGAGCVILDHDAHSLDALQRRDYAIDSQNIAKDPVVIGEDVLLGARCIVLKGVHIGDRSIVGAGSVVTCDIPSDEIWAGNPARKIRSL